MTLNPSNKLLMNEFDINRVSFSDDAINHFTTNLEKNKDAIGIKIGIRKAGCSGYEYFFDFIQSSKGLNLIFENNACRIFIDKFSFDFLKGSKVDYVNDGLNSGIKFLNPNAKAVCGCGESFTV